jgi:3-phenylpropionate/trans-cinnamate dioxygenase ferredoxin subunit
VKNYCKERGNQMTWIEIAQVSQLPVKGMKAFSMEDKEALVASYEGKHYALDNICPHTGGHLSDGILEGNIVIRPAMVPN